MTTPTAIIIPTWDNTQYLQPCLTSLLSYTMPGEMYHVYVINNGHPESCDWVKHDKVTVVQTGGKNLGWEGGLKLGLQQSDSELVVFLNDDTHIPQSSALWLYQILAKFADPTVGAVGPATNVVMGVQNIFAHIPHPILSVKFLVGYCLAVRRSALEEVGGVDDTLPGGDDLDLSIRLRDKGYRLLADRSVFVYHHGFKTGTRIYGNETKAGGWNSYEFKEKTDFALIKKHGFRKWYDCIRGGYETPVASGEEDSEGKIIRERITGRVVIDLGCGTHKTIPTAIGLDINPEVKPDLVHDLTKPLPFPDNHADTIIARHVLEHILNPVKVLDYWIATLKPGGRLIIAVPNQDRLSSIPMNLEHVHAYTPESLHTFLTACGLTIEEQLDSQNGVSFITVAEKVAK